MSRSCPGDVPEMSRRCPGDVPEMSPRCPGGVPEMSRRIPGRPPHVVCFRFRRFIFWVFFFPGFGRIFLFLCVFVVFWGFVRFGIEKTCRIQFRLQNPFVLFVVQSIPSIFCFTVVLRCFSLLGRDGDLNFLRFKFFCRNCFQNPS